MYRKLLPFRASALKECASLRSFSRSAAVHGAKVGFIGLGNMGSHMAMWVLRGGHPLVVCDTRRDAVRPFILADAEVAASPAELASKVDRVITMVPTPADVLQVYLGQDGVLAGARKGSILIDSSTVDPDTSKLIAARAAERGFEFVDAPVSGAVPAARAGTLTFLVGGNPATFEKIRELLLTMGKNAVHCGDTVGNGEIAKLCNNMLAAISMIGTSETLNLGARLGLDPQLLTQILNISSGRSWASEIYNPVPGCGGEHTPSSNEYEGGFGTKLMAKDLNLAQGMAVQSQSPTPLGALAAQIYRLMSNNGYAYKDFSYSYQFIKQSQP